MKFMENNREQYLSSKILKKNTEVDEQSFSSLNLELLNFGYRVHDSFIETLIEISSSSCKWKYDMKIVIDFCNINNQIVKTSPIFIKRKHFAGYDTMSTITVGPQDDLSSSVVKAKIHVEELTTIRFG